MRWFIKITWGLAATPVLLIFLAVTLLVHARLGLGHWPKPGESYRTELFDLHEGVLWLLLLFTMSAVTLWVVAICLKQFQISMVVHFMQALLYAAGWGLIFFLLKHNAWGAAKWGF